MLPALQRIVYRILPVGICQKKPIEKPMVLQFAHPVAGYAQITVDDLLGVLFHALGEEMTDEKQLKTGNILARFEGEGQVLSSLEQNMLDAEIEWGYTGVGPNQEPLPTLLSAALDAFFTLDETTRKNLLTSYLNKKKE